MHSDPVRVAAVEALPLGGVGEFGMNMMAVRCGGTGLLVDAGVMFPGPERFGVDLVIPDIAELCGGACFDKRPPHVQTIGSGDVDLIANLADESDAKK